MADAQLPSHLERRRRGRPARWARTADAPRAETETNTFGAVPRSGLGTGSRSRCCERIEHPRADGDSTVASLNGMRSWAYGAPARSFFSGRRSTRSLSEANH
jgi:hypothetical protein